jgi:hypothetical protein
VSSSFLFSYFLGQNLVVSRDLTLRRYQTSLLGSYREPKVVLNVQPLEHCPETMHQYYPLNFNILLIESFGVELPSEKVIFQNSSPRFSLRSLINCNFEFFGASLVPQRWVTLWKMWFVTAFIFKYAQFLFDQKPLSPLNKSGFKPILLRCSRQGFTNLLSCFGNLSWRSQLIISPSLFSAINSYKPNSTSASAFPRL